MTWRDPGDLGRHKLVSETWFKRISTQAVTKLKLGLWERVSMPVKQPDASRECAVSP